MPITPSHREYWRRNLRMTAALFAVWFAVTFGVGWFARDLAFDFFGWWNFADFFGCDRCN